LRGQIARRGEMKKKSEREREEDEEEEGIKKNPLPSFRFPHC
jgi:hypothetical protein